MACVAIDGHPGLYRCPHVRSSHATCRFPASATGAPHGPHISSSVAPRLRMMALTGAESAASANPRSPRVENVAGDFYVDSTCIDCDTCRWMSPDVFGRVNGLSAVTAQPASEAQRIRSLQALLSCPTHSIHVRKPPGSQLRLAQQGLPEPVPGCSAVYNCGWHSEKSFGGASYLLVRPEGNILVDSPRFGPVLLKRLQELGGAKYMFLTHRDDVADHREWSRALGCTRIIHQLEAQHNLQDVEVQLEGEGPWGLPGEQADGDVQMIFTPGHTEGHVVLFYRPQLVMFTGDHLSAGRIQEDPAHLHIFRDYNWYSVQAQLESVRKLASFDFLHVLPGHGRQLHFRDGRHRHQELDRLLRSHGLPGIADA